jgi:hypothetical protein
MFEFNSWTIISMGILWLAAGLGLAWVFGGASSLGGPDDPRVERCDHGLPLPDCSLCGPEPLIADRKIDHSISASELEAKAK